MELALADEMRETLTAVLDRVIPASEDGRLPGAGELGLVSVFEEKADADPGLAAVLEAGIAAVDVIAERHAGARFAALSADEQTAALEEIDTTQPDFIPRVVFHLYASYYQSPRIQLALGLEGRPPYPKGYELEVGDLSLLDPVRARETFYREP